MCQEFSAAAPLTSDNRCVQCCSGKPECEIMFSMLVQVTVVQWGGVVVLAVGSQFYAHKLLMHFA